MAHQRIRKFNTRDTYPDQKLDNDLCQVVVAKGTMVFVRGQVGQDLATSKSVGIGDAGAQADQAMKNIAILLAEAATLGAAPLAELIQSRFIDTLLGCVVGLVGGICLHSPRFREVVGGPMRKLVPRRPAR